MRRVSLSKQLICTRLLAMFNWVLGHQTCRKPYFILKSNIKSRMFYNRHPLTKVDAPLGVMTVSTSGLVRDLKRVIKQNGDQKYFPMKFVCARSWICIHYHHVVFMLYYLSAPSDFERCGRLTFDGPVMHPSETFAHHWIKANQKRREIVKCLHTSVVFQFNKQLLVCQ